MHLVLHMRSSSREETMVEQPVNLPTAIYLGVFSRAEQRILQAIFKGQSRKVAADVSLPSQCLPATRTPASQPRATPSPKRSHSGSPEN